ncbi:MAG: serine hydrolase [Candidatus Woykebacteria bacterium]
MSRRLIFIAAALIFLLILLVFKLSVKEPEKIVENGDLSPTQVLNSAPLQIIENDLLPLQKILQAEVAKYKGDVAISVTDLKSLFSAEVGQDKSFYPASTIKFLILVGVFKDIEEGKYSFAETAPLIKSMMSISSNQAANALIREVGIEKLSLLPAEIGLYDTLFIHGFEDGTKNPLPRLRIGSNAMSTRDANLFWQKLYRGELLNKDSTKKALQYSTLPDVKVIYASQGDALYHKSGYIDAVSSEVFHDSGIVETDNFSYLVSFFSRNNPSHEEGKKFGLRVTKIVYAWFSKKYS